MQVSGREVSFPGWELGFPLMTVGLRGLTETSRRALREVPSRLLRPVKVLGRALRRCLG